MCGYTWGAYGEANALRKVRAFAKEFGFAKENTEFVGYWRATTTTNSANNSCASASSNTNTTVDENTKGTPNSTAGESSHDIFHRQTTMLDITTGIIVREAMALGIFETLLRHPLNLDALAQATNTLPQDLERLLLFLESVGMLTRTGGDLA